MNIRICNLRNYELGKNEVLVRIDRMTVFGNPFRIARYSDRQAVIDKYRRWLWSQVKNRRGKLYQSLKDLLLIGKQNKTLVLGCFCHPQPCHGDIIKKCLLWLESELSRK